MYSTIFDTLSCQIEQKVDKKRVFKSYIIDNVDMLNLDDESNSDTKYLVTQSEDS